MTTIEIEQKMTAAFLDGDIRRRELRLTEEEAAYITACYPAVLTLLGRSTDKSWYEITFQGAEN